MYFHTKWYSTYLFIQSVGFSSGISVSTIFSLRSRARSLPAIVTLTRRIVIVFWSRWGGLLNPGWNPPSAVWGKPAAFETNVNCGLRCFFGNFIFSFWSFFFWLALVRTTPDPNKSGVKKPSKASQVGWRPQKTVERFCFATVATAGR